MRQFDNNASAVLSQPDMTNDVKFQTPKGPSMFHNNSINQTVVPAATTPE
jgi:hypothetical protein